MSIYHKHHIIPKHMGGTDDPSNLITVTEEAAKRMKDNIAKRGKPTEGIRIEVRGKGCSGMSYTMEFCDQAEEKDHIIEQDGLKIFVDPKSIPCDINEELLMLS